MPQQSHYDSDSSDGETCQSVTTETYTRLQLDMALHNRFFRRRALAELEVLLVELYPQHMNKEAQALMLADLRTAVNVLDGCKAYSAQLSRLMRLCEKRLPQQKRQQLQAAYKHACLSLQRKQRGKSVASSAGSSDSDGDEHDSPPATLRSLPTEVVEAILSHLPPASLAMACCVSRQWRSLAVESRVWEQAVRISFSSHAARLTKTAASPEANSWHCQFCTVAKERPKATAQWLCGGRVFVRAAGKGTQHSLALSPQWDDAAVSCNYPQRQQVVYPTPQQVARWVTRRPLMHDGDSSSSSSSCSSSNSSDEVESDEPHRARAVVPTARASSLGKLQRQYRLWDVGPKAEAP